MTTREQVESYNSALGEVKTAALGELREMLDQLEGATPAELKQVLFEVVPQVFDPYAAATSDISATFYEESRTAAGSPTPYTPKALGEPVPVESWNALVGYSTASDESEADAVARAFDRLSGGLTKRLTGVAADTQHQNAVEDPDPVSFQRVPSPGCCGFCGMLASRGAVYGSRAEAGKVMGRGIEVEKSFKADGTRKSGGQARGLRLRGTRKAGEDFHDNCNCAVIAVHQGNAVEMQADAYRYLDAFREAQKQVDDGLERHIETHRTADGSLKNTYSWVDADGNLWTDKERRREMARVMNTDPGVMDSIAAEAFPNRPPAFGDLFEQATPKPTASPTLTYENVAGLTDDELMEAMSTVFVDDPEAWDKIEGIMERREADALKVDAAAATAEPEPYVDPFGTVLDGKADPLKTKARKLTPNERVAEEYWSYASNQYQTALEDLNGILFNKKYAKLAREKGVSEDALFMGPLHVANKYASEELKAWWAVHGRETQTSYRYMALGRPSDRKAWLSVQKQGLHASGSSERRRLGI